MGGFVTHAEQGYANATMIVEMQQDYTEVLANLATATETDREAFNVLTHWNDKEVGRNKCRNSRAETEYRRKKVFAPQAVINPTGYCWTHGYKVKYGHDSKTCGTKKRVIKTTLPDNA